MTSYLDHLLNAYSVKTFKRKIAYIRYNIMPMFQSHKNGLSFLEIGPGLGEFVSVVSQTSNNVIDVVDLDAGILTYVRKHFPVRFAYQTDDLVRIDKKLGQYDGIIAIQLLEHVPPTQYASFLKTLLQHTKKGGKLIFVVPNANNPLGLTERYGDLQHYTSFTTRSIQDFTLLADQDLKVSIKGYEIPPTDLVNVLRIVAQKALHTVLVLLMAINGGTYFTVMTPNIMVVIEKK